MTTWSKRLGGLALLLALAGGAAALGASCSGRTASSNRPKLDAGRDASAETSGDTGRDTGLTDGRAEASEASSDSSPACDPDPHSSYIPKGWVRFPGLGCACTVWLSPSASTMNPAPSWVTTPGGWLELNDPAAGDANTAGIVGGDSYEGRQEIAYARIPYPGIQENAVLDVTDGKYTYEDRILGNRNYQGPYFTAIDAIGQGVVLHEAWQVSTGPEYDVTAVTTAASPVPTVLGANYDSPQGWAVGAHVAGIEVAYNRMDAFTWPPPHAYPNASVYNGTVQPAFGWNSTLFFIKAWFFSGGVASRYDTWTAAAGDQPLVGTDPSSSSRHSICGLVTDGTTLVWTELSGWDGHNWQQAEIMQAPFTTDATALEPTPVRPAPGYKECYQPWVVGGGYAAATIPLNKSATQLAGFVVRLADGAEWELQVPGAEILPLYITHTELGALQSLNPPVEGGPEGLIEYHIIRYPLSLLGAPSMP